MGHHYHLDRVSVHKATPATTAASAVRSCSMSDTPQVLFVDGLNGSNSNNGSASAPYQTLNHTVEVICSTFPTGIVTVIVAAVSPEFIYTDMIVFPWTCVNLSLTITSINPAADDSDATSQLLGSSGRALLDIPMAQLNWTTFNGSAIMNLLFDHVTFVDQTVLYFFPNIDFGSKAMYTLSLQNCVVRNVTTDMILPGSEDQDEQPTILSGTQLLLNNSLVIDSTFPAGFVFVWAGNPTYAYITSTHFLNNNGPIWTSNYITVPVFDQCEFHNNTVRDVYSSLLYPRAVFQESSAPDALPPMFNFTNNIVDGNSFQQLISVDVTSPCFIEHNKITNNVVDCGYFDNATSQVANDNLTIPIVVSNNLFSCNGASDGTFYAFLNRDLSVPPPTNWLLANNVNGDPVNCPIRPLPGNELADSVNTQSCFRGYYNNPSTGSVHCVPCASGSYSPFFGETSCTLCYPGSYSSNEGTIECFPCNSGNFSSQAGATSCEKCPSGTCTPPFGDQTSCQPEPCPTASRFDINISFE